MRLAARGLCLPPMLHGISLEVRPGETLGLIGPNGAGKSSLLRLLAGIVAPAQGEVLLDGAPLRRLGRRAVAQRLAFVQQQAETAERLSVRDAVELGRTPWLSALRPWSPDDDAIVASALARMELTHLAGRDWAHLSGGERQRVHLARALAQQPRLLLLDEPGNHLDIHHQLAAQRLLARLGLTVVIALHDLNQAMSCDRLAVLHQGRLVALGTPAAVLTPDLLRTVFAVRGAFVTDPTDGTRLLRLHALPEG